MRTRIAAAAALTVTAVLLAGCVESGAEKEKAEGNLVGEGKGDDCKIDDPVKVGAVVSLTGGAAFAGKYQQEGLQLAFKELNKKDGVDYKLIEEDDKTDKKESIKDFEMLIEEEKVSVLIGPTLSSQAFSTYQDANEAGVPAVGISTTAEGIPEIGDYIFRDSLPEQYALNASIPAAKDALGLKDVAVLYDKQDDFTSSAYNTIKETLTEENIDIVADESFQTSDSEFRSQLTKVKAKDPDALILSALPAATIPMVTQARQLGIDAPIVGGNAFNSPVLIDQLGKAAEGLIVGGAWSADADTPGNEEFIKSYKKAYDRMPDQFAAQAYTAGFLIDEAVRTDCDGNREAIKDNLGQILEFDTVLGKLSLDESGEVTQKPVVQIVKDGKLTLLK